MGPLSALRVVLRTSPSVARAVVAEAEEACELLGQRWTCTVPAARLDLQLRPGDLVPKYAWDVEVEPGLETDLGTLTLEAGGSVTGFLQGSDGSPIKDGRVELHSPRGEPIAPSATSKEASSPFVGQANHRGFFQLKGMPPADYRIVGSRPELTDDSVAIRILPGRESKLSRPLVLARPSRLTLTIEPALDPSGQPWSVELRTAPEQSSRARTIQSASEVDAAGRWVAESIAPGRYAASVSSAASATVWLRQEIEVNPEPTDVSIHVPLVEVRGSVLLGTKALGRAKLLFGGRARSVGIPMEADDSGEFKGLLPVKPDAAERGVSHWEVYVTADQPRVVRNLKDVAVDTKSGKAVVEIVLAAGQLEVEVVGADGRPYLEPALVTGQHSGGADAIQAVLTEKDGGKVLLEGLELGQYLVSAAGRNISSDHESVLVEEGADHRRVRLVLRDDRRLLARVLSPEGTPVPGAMVKVVLLDNPLLPAPVKRTNEQGTVELNLPPNTAAVGMSVGAQGFAYALGREILAGKDEVTIRLERLGGKLNLKLPDSVPDGRMAVLVANGTYETVQYIGWTGLGKESPGPPRELTIPLLRPGRYSACIAQPTDIPGLMAAPRNPAEICVQGDVVPLGDLVLDARSLSKSSP
jgi:hypothetical protein